jgi:hypothetical protein
VFSATSVYEYVPAASDPLAVFGVALTFVGALMIGFSHVSGFVR